MIVVMKKITKVSMHGINNYKSKIDIVKNYVRSYG